MTASKMFVRDFLGLLLIVCTVLAGLCVLLCLLALFAYVNHETILASDFFHESFYLIAFLYSTLLHSKTHQPCRDGHCR